MGAGGWALAVAAAVVAAGVQSASGFGQALVLAPVLFAVCDTPAEALVALLGTALLVNVLVLGAERRATEVDRGVLRRVLVAGLPGLVLGALLLRSLDRDAVQLGVGAMVAAAIALRLVGRRRAGGVAPAGTAGSRGRPRRVARLDGPAGLVAGALTTTTSISGPPLVLQLSRHGLASAAFRDTLVAVLLALDVGAVAVLAATTPDAFGPGGVLTAALVPSTLLGHRLGRAVFLRAGARFEPAVLALALAAAAAGVLAALI